MYSLLPSRGWLCPGGSLQEQCFSIRNQPVKNGKANRIKYLIWIPWLLVIVAAAFSAGGFKQINPLYMTESGISLSRFENYVIYYFVIAVFVSMSLIVGRRAGCHYICWMAPFDHRRQDPANRQVAFTAFGGRQCQVHQLQAVRSEMPDEPWGARPGHEWQDGP